MVNSLVPEIAKEDLPQSTLETIVPQVEVPRVIKPAPPRYRNEIAKYIIRRSADCKMCGKCAELCTQGVHVLKGGYKYFAAPRHNVCIGPSCRENVLLARHTARTAIIMITSDEGFMGSLNSQVKRSSRNW